MAEPTYQFVMSAGPTPGKVYPLEKDELFIGRDLTNDIVINDAEISRRHARLVNKAGGYVIEDLGSTNGTFVNGQRINQPYVMRSGESITLGEHVTLGYEVQNYDPDATVVAGQAMPTVEPPTQSQFTPPPPPPPAASMPPVSRPVAPAPSYSGQIPSGPVQVEPVTPPKKRGLPTWAIILIVLVVLCLCVCVVGGFIVDRNNLWCQLFPFIPGCGG